MMDEALALVPVPRRFSWRQLKDRLAGRLFFSIALLPCLLIAIMLLALLIRARPILAAKSIGDLLLGRDWHPLQGQFGLYPFIAGTVWVTLVAMIIAVPLCLLCSIYLSEYAGPRVRGSMKPMLDVLAGIPSVIYGVWGVIAIVPLVQDGLAPLLSKALGFLPLFAANNPTGFSVLSGGIVLAVMVTPIIIAVTYEVMQTVPQGLREASLAVGATKWQTIKHAVLPKALPGLMAAIVLGFSRAFGETIAVLMVVGNVAQVPASIFDPAYPLTALIANNYGEMMSIPLYDAALLGAALILLLIVLAFNIASTLLLRRIVGRSIG
jgi:phosphate transport system permease protein